ncbi:hypothetical protein ACFVRE_42855, partial [Streptomyces sp. NPDC057910]
NSTNPHLLISPNTATTTTAVGTFWLDKLVRPLPVGLDRLRQDRSTSHMSSHSAPGPASATRPPSPSRPPNTIRAPPEPPCTRRPTSRLHRWVRREDPSEFANSRRFQFSAFYCAPGEDGAHEKGGVEGQVGYFRRNYLTPVPQVDSVDELNARLAEFEAKEDGRRIGARMRTIAQDFAREAGHLLPLPDDPFATGITLTPRVDRYGMITVKMCRYSVPVRFIDRKVTVTLTCDDLTVYDGRREIARHRRLTGRGAEHLVLEHYLEALLTKPGALERSEALHQARAGGTFTAVHEAFWAAAKKALGDIEGTKALVKVLLLHRHQQHAEVTGIRAALAAGTFNEDVIALEARKAAQAAGRAPTVTASSLAPEPLDLDPVPVTRLTSRRRARALPSDQRPLPRLEQWDELLQLRRKDSS